MKNIIIFASGNGSNAENIATYFRNSQEIKIAALFCNNPGAGVIERMKRKDIPVHLFDRETFGNEEIFLPMIAQYDPQLIVLAGFLWLIPPYLVKAFEGRIINIHPALLPKFGGKGMYGHRVHEAVLAAGEKEHGITIHFVNTRYDEGPPIFQAKFKVEEQDTVDTISAKIADLEMQYFPEAIRRILGS